MNGAMKVKQSIKIKPNTYEKMFTLPCVTAVVRDEKRKCRFTVALSAEHTRGRLRANVGDWLVQYTTGEWQVFGPKAYETLVHNPKESPWE